jgi:hemolysin activation/secretion protein
VAPGTVIPPPTAPGGEVPNRPVRVTSIEVEGVTAYPRPEIAQLAAGLIGPAVPLPQIDAARQAILQHYRTDGYVLTTVSANLDNSGRLRFVVTEGRIASVKLDGDIGPAGTQVLRFLNRLTEQQPIDSVTLERYLLLAQLAGSIGACAPAGTLIVAEKIGDITVQAPALIGALGPAISPQPVISRRPAV